MTHPIRDVKRGLSALMTGPVAQLIPANQFPADNIIMARDHYSYEGNWSPRGCEGQRDMAA